MAMAGRGVALNARTARDARGTFSVATRSRVNAATLFLRLPSESKRSKFYSASNDSRPGGTTRPTIVGVAPEHSQNHGFVDVGGLILKRGAFTLPGVVAICLSSRRVAEANGAGVHIGNLSDTATYAVIGAFVAVVGLFVLMFVLRWRATALSQALEADDAADPESEDEG